MGIPGTWNYNKAKSLVANDDGRVARAAFAERGRIFDRRQAELRHKLLSATDVGDKWCWLHPPMGQCCMGCVKKGGTLVRHILQADNCSVYRGLDTFPGHNSDWTFPISHAWSLPNLQ